MWKTLILLTLITTIAACAQQRESRRVAFDGIAFRSKTAAVDKKVTRAEFAVEVRDAAQSINAARRAGHYEGIKYCIAEYGTSDITWVSDPLDPEAQLTMSGPDLLLQGTCQP